MTKARTAAGLGAALGMLILILDGKTALSGGIKGVELCIRTVIPSLFPFFVLSAMLTSAFIGTKISLPASVVPEGAESLLITGFLGGYPVGAQNIATAYRSKQLTRLQAERMLAFCNNAGPAFLFGMIAPMFPDGHFAWMLWLIHIISALVTALALPNQKDASAALTPGTVLTLPEAMKQAIRVMASVCGWIVLFRVGISFLDKWVLWLFPVEAQVLITGLLELSNGCVRLSEIEDTAIRFIICSGILSFGGLCVTMQTLSVTQGLRLHLYFPGKMLQTVLSIFLSWLILPKDRFSPFLPVLALGAGMVFLVYLRKMQNNSSIPRRVVV